MIWLRIWANGGLLWTWRWTFGIYKILENYWVAVQLATSQEGLSSMDLVGWLVRTQNVLTSDELQIIWALTQLPSSPDENILLLHFSRKMNGRFITKNRVDTKCHINFKSLLEGPCFHFVVWRWHFSHCCEWLRCWTFTSYRG
jgi:hypothetical protein